MPMLIVCERVDTQYSVTAQLQLNAKAKDEADLRYIELISFAYDHAYKLPP